MDTFVVNFTGPVLSVLLYENIGHGRDQEGFLLGNVIEQATNKVTDADQRVVITKRTIHIRSIIPCTQQFRFYDSVGQVDQRRLRSLLGKQHDQLVGWFRFKHNPLGALTLREKLIHKQLAHAAHAHSENNFVLCVLAWDSTHDFATHTFAQRYFHYHRADFRKLPVRITNLSEPNRDYKLAEPHSDSFNRILRSVKGGGGEEEERGGQRLEHVSRIQGATQRHLEALIVEVAAAEKELFALQREVETVGGRGKGATNPNGNGEMVGGGAAPLTMDGVENGEVEGPRTPRKSSRLNRAAEGKGLSYAQIAQNK